MTETEQHSDEVLRTAYGLAVLDATAKATHQLANETATATKSAHLLIDALEEYGVALSVDRKIRQAAIRHNHGRARKVSFKRPSPQISRLQLGQVKALAIVEATLEAA